MPATEQTWRNQKWMHIVFGVSSILMLLATIWMLAKDHDREWKPVQRKFRDIEAWYTQARISEQDDPQYEQKTRQLQQALAVTQAQPLPATVGDDFMNEARKRATELGYNLDALQASNEALQGKVTELHEAEVKLVEALTALGGAVSAGGASDPEETKANRAAVLKAIADLTEVARTQSPPTADVDNLIAAVKTLPASPAEPTSAVAESSAALAKVSAEVAASRKSLLESMNAILRKAQFDEDKVFSLLKFRRADLDVVRSSYNLGVNEGLPEDELQHRLKAVDKVKAEVDEMTGKYQEAKTHRLALEAILVDATADELTAKKELADHLAKLQQLEKAKQDQTLTPVKDILTLPVIEGFNGPLKIDQIWLPQLTLNNNFKDVARFDRCVTCHQAIDKTAPGGLPAYPARPENLLTIPLKTPAEAPAALIASPPTEAKERARWVETLYGLQLADRGLMKATDVTISVARNVTPAADAGLQVGDVIKEINGVIISDHEAAYRGLLSGIDWGKPLTLKIERGLPHPFSSHPRLDLYLGSLSPHKMQNMGCTICHEGQGSATTFQWSSHTPNSPHQASEWKDEHGWFNNHHWIYPMKPDRFVESSCLKCHQNLAELEPSEKFPDPPAPKLMEGFDIIHSYGCFG